MNSRERVLHALNHQPVDRLPLDMGGMASTGISCFAYPGLVAALGLTPRRPRVHDTSQMLALPDPDVLTALGCDVVTIFWGVTNAFEQPEAWHPYDFNSRLPARVREPAAFSTLPDGTIEQAKWQIKMPPSSHVFEQAHGGQPLNFIDDGELPLKDLKRLKQELEAALPTAKEIRETRELCRRVREASDRAVFFNGPGSCEIAISAHGGMGVFPLICTLHPDYVLEYHEVMIEHSGRKLDMLLPEIAPYIDIMLLGGDDWGTQNALIAKPQIFRDLFLPFYTRHLARARRHAPQVKAFLHSCGAIYDLIDMIIAAGFDILNPVQWTAGGHPYTDWKAKCQGRIALWGGGVNSQQTLPFGTLEDVAHEVAAIVACLGQGGGYIFNPIHNLLAEVEPAKIIAMYEVARNWSPVS